MLDAGDMYVKVIVMIKNRDHHMWSSIFCNAEGLAEDFPVMLSAGGDVPVMEPTADIFIKFSKIFYLHNHEFLSSLLTKSKDSSII